VTQSHRNEFVAYVQYLAETELGPYAYRLVKDRADADDIVKETVTEALRREDEFDSDTGIDGLKKWVLSICRNQAESYQPAVPGAKIALTMDTKRRFYPGAHESGDPLLDATRRMLQADDRKPLSYTGILSDSSDENEFARRLSKSAANGKSSGTSLKHRANVAAPKSQAYTARTQQRQADTEGRSRQFFDDLLNNILAQKDETDEAPAGA